MVTLHQLAGKRGVCSCSDYRQALLTGSVGDTVAFGM